MLAEPRVGRTFGRVAAEYERARPDYPRGAVQRAADELGLTPQATVLDLAAGTGKLTRVLGEMFAQVIAVEPDDGMRRHISGDARSGTAERIPVADATVNAVFVADAFHWFDARAALGEIGRVVRSGGGLALLGNHWWESEEPKMPAEARALLDELFARFHPDGPSNRAWREDVEAALGPLGHAEFTTRMRYTGRMLAALCMTTSSPAALDDDERAGVGRRLAALLDADYTLRVTTSVYWARLS